jgi:AmmeMemoRadiSam system protein A
MPLTLLLKLLEGKHLGDTESRLCSYYTSAHLTHAREGNAFINVPDLLGDLPDSAARESVSYGAVVFTAQRLNELKPENQLTGFEKRSLTTMARESIENELAQQTHQPAQLLWPIVTPSLTKPQGVFVTLHDHDNRLRGCIGRITSLKPTYQTTQDMAIAAAFKDERFKPLTKEELDNEVHLSISILSQPERVFALSNIVLGKHGIILNKFKDDGTLLASSVFLPQVPPSMNWDLATTLAELSVKAGLPRDGWQDNCELQIFEGYEVKEEV